MALPDDLARLARAGLRPPADPARGLFRADGWLRRVSREPVVLFGGGRALLLEVAHPLVAAGVAQHSDFRGDPFGRLRRTLDAMGAITFGDRAEALAAVAGVERAHDRVCGSLARAAGPFPAGTPYSGRNPELVRWVWATLVDTALEVYTRFVAALPEAALADYYRDQAAIARLLGVPDALVPADVDAFRAWFAAMLEGETLHVTAEARAIADAVFAAPSAGLVRPLTAALLPPRLRDAFGLPWGAASAARVERLAASVKTLRRERPVDASADPR